MLAGANITKAFAGETILHGIDLAIERGQITVVIGPSGGGKTTLLRALSLVEPPDTGTITITNGARSEEVYSFPNHHGAQPALPWPRVTVVFQQLFLWPHLTLRQNIWLPVRKWDRGKKERHLNELIEAFGMSPFIDRYPNHASLGQRQRAALARALIVEPEYILLDEVTSALDVEQTEALLSHLELARAQGIGILAITHSIGFARRVANQLAFLDKGQILDIGGKEILDDPRHPRLKQFLNLY